MEICKNIIPTDDSTLFICSGMQELKPKFNNPDGTTHSSIQSCIRTNDLDSIGNGTHLSSFDMIGNFSFAATPYKKSCEMWLEITTELCIEPVFVTYHPDKEDHCEIWQSLGVSTIQSEDCIWSDGSIGGYCTEMFRGGISEKQRKNNAIKSAKSTMTKHRNKSYEFWLATFGLLPKEVDQLLNN
jgi:alanyl-tRNA synthetase